MHRSVLHIDPDDRSLLLQYLEHGIPLFLEGPPGVGKSLSARELGVEAYQTRCGLPERQTDAIARGDRCTACVQGRSDVRDEDVWCHPLKIDITEDTEVRHLLGDLDYLQLHLYSQGMTREAERDPVAAAERLRAYARTHCFQEGPLVRAVREGRLLIVEELDRAGRDTLLSVFFDPIERKQVYVPELATTVSPDSGLFNIVITINGATDAGTIRLPRALLRRLRRLELYDPMGDPNAECAIAFETEILIRNVTHVHPDLDERIEELRAVLRVLIEQIVRPIRLERMESGAPLPRISPAESAALVLDLLQMEPERFLEADLSTLVALVAKFAGALAKTGEELRTLREFLADHDVRRREAAVAAEANRRRQELDGSRRIRQEARSKIQTIYERLREQQVTATGSAEESARQIASTLNARSLEAAQGVVAAVVEAAEALGADGYATDANVPVFDPDADPTRWTDPNDLETDWQRYLDDNLASACADLITTELADDGRLAQLVSAKEDG